MRSFLLMLSVLLRKRSFPFKPRITIFINNPDRVLRKLFLMITFARSERFINCLAGF